MENQNKFIVDLGSLSLTPEQRKKFQAAIESAAAGELANLDLQNKIALLPLRDHIGGPIINGIVVRELNKDLGSFLSH